MKAFACGDVVPGCDTSWVCSDEDEVLARVAVHAREVHGIAEVPQALVDEVRRRMVSTP